VLRAPAEGGGEQYLELKVFEGIAERTGASFTRTGVRGRRGICRNLTALRAMCRRFGDGYYYLAESAWGEGVQTLDVRKVLWTVAAAGAGAG
jgi:hypothetical protein